MRNFGPVITIDLETTTKKSYKRLANPFDPDNRIVYVGWQIGPGDPQMVRFATGMPDGWFAAMLEEHWPMLLIGINIKFDLLHLIRQPKDYAAYQRWVAAGGNVWDGQLSEYLIEGMGQDSHMLSMDELAPRYGGNTKFDEVKELWKAGVQTEDIDPDLIKRYLIGNATEHGDIGNTYLTFKGQLARARACGQVKSILMNSGSLLCTTEMERNGMRVDVDRGRIIAKKIEEEIATLVTELVQSLPSDLPFDFNWGSAQQKSALLFGGTVHYDKWLPHLTEDGQMQYAMKTVTGYATVYNPTNWVQEPEGGWSGEEESRLLRFASGKNAGELKTKQIKVPNMDKPKGAIQKVPYVFKGYTTPSKKWATSTPGQYQTGAEVIAELGNRDIPFLKSLAKRTSLAKDLTTYYITINDKGEEVGMLTLVQADGMIHHMLNHTSTVTARFSSSNPNLQNIPKGNKSDVKTIFISRWGAKGKIIQSDFTALEVYVQAILTKCLQLIADLKAGLDMHCVRVSQKKGIAYEAALKLCKGYVDDEGVWHDAEPEWDYERTKAKVFSFQRAYGAGAAKIADSTGMPQEEVEALIVAEETRYPEIKAFNDKLIATLENSAVDTGHYVQHPDLPGVTCHLRKATWRAPDNKLYAWKQSPAPDWLAKMPASKGGRITSFSPTEVKNYPTQGTGGEWAKAAMWLAVREFYRTGNFDGFALLVNQVHDALYSDAEERAAYAAAVTLHACMEEASSFMEYYFGWLVPVPVPSDTKWGDSMAAEGKLPDGFKEDVEIARLDVRKRYMGDFIPSFTKE